MFDKEQEGRLNSAERTAAEKFFSHERSRPAAKSVGRR